MSSIQGSCLCGNIQYSSHLLPLTTAICHCNDCQKQSGSAFSVNILLPVDGFSIDGASLGFYSKSGSSGLSVKRFFCTNCGSALYSEVDVMPGMIAIKGGSLTDPTSIKPQLHLWCSSALPWVDIDGSLPCFKEASPNENE